MAATALRYCNAPCYPIACHPMKSRASTVIATEPRGMTGINGASPNQPKKHKNNAIHDR